LIFAILVGAPFAARDSKQYERTVTSSATIHASPAPRLGSPAGGNRLADDPPVRLTAVVPTEFRSGVALCQAFYAEVVAPLLARAHPGLPYAAALLGPGSDVLGYDTRRSTDHDWGPRLRLFLRPADAHLAPTIDELLCRELPPNFAGFPTHFTRAADGVWVMGPASGPVRHRVLISTTDSWYARQLGFLPRSPVTLLDWLATPTQLLLEQTAGAVYRDDLGAVTAARAALAWYPDDVWRYLLAAQWQRIAEEEPFVGRCDEVGDELGAGIVTGRLVRDLSRLHLLMQRRYPPYSKWLGSAVAARPELAAGLTEPLRRTGAARQDALCRCLERAVEAHNGLRLTDPLAATRRPFHSRPYLVIDAGRIAAALRATITDPAVAALPPMGAVDQFVDSTALIDEHTARRAAVAAALTR
jgi:hypothetical protein